MTATIVGGGDVARFLASLPANLERNVIRGAVKAGAEVIADAAREGCRSSEVRESIKVATRTENGSVTAKIQTIGEGAYLAPWLEFGTDPHFITVDAKQSEGRTVRRINKLEKQGSLVIGGTFVGSTVHHPGARPYPFMRPAVDTHQAQAIAAIGAGIAMRMTKAGIETPPPAEPGE